MTPLAETRRDAQQPADNADVGHPALIPNKIVTVGVAQSKWAVSGKWTGAIRATWTETR